MENQNGVFVRFRPNFPFLNLGEPAFTAGN